jgi:ABC-type Co2+ transport system permease subunit
MTMGPQHQQEVRRVVDKLLKEGVPRWAVSSPFHRLIWYFNIPIPPPVYSPRWASIMAGIQSSILFTITYLIAVLVLSRNWIDTVGEVCIVFALAGFVAVDSGYTKYLACIDINRRLCLTSWREELQKACVRSPGPHSSDSRADSDQFV